MENSASSARTWSEDLIDYFQELGGEAHYSELYRHIEANPRRPLGKEWQAVVRRTIEEHSSDTTIWTKRRLPDLFRSVNGLGAGRWALRNPEGVSPTTFTLRPGDQIRRTDLHGRFGGSRQGGMAPSSTSPNVFLFTDPETGLQHGYVDGWKDDGCFHYTGMGQRGDQEMAFGNKAVLNHRADGRDIRLFRGSRGIVTYDGQFELDQTEPYYLTDAPETGGGPNRQVIVFRLRPINSSAPPHDAPPAPPLVTAVSMVPMEEQHAETMVVNPPSSTTEAERREARLCIAFRQYVESKGMNAVRAVISPGGRAWQLLTDIFVSDLNLLIEAKGTCERAAFRMAIGQLADYRRFLSNPKCAILLPSRPTDDLLDLARVENIGVIWPDGAAFTGTIELSDGAS